MDADARLTLYSARWVVPVAAAPIRDGAVAVDAVGRVAYVGPAVDAPTAALHALGDAVLLPGLVAITAPGSSPGATDPVMQRALGVTTVAQAIAPDALGDAEVDAVLRSGMRAMLYHPIAGTRGDERPAALAALAAQVGRTRAAIDAAGASARVQRGVAPAPITAISEELLLDACAWAVGENLPLAITAGATADEIAFIRDGAGASADLLRARGIAVGRRAHSTVHLLAELGIAPVAGPLLVGGAHLDASDLALAAYYGCTVAYVPAAGPTSLAGVRDGGARTTLAGGPGPLAAVRGLTDPPHDALALVTRDAAAALGLADVTGTLEVGKAADLTVFALDAVALQLADTAGPEVALLTRDSGPALLALVAGRPAPARDSHPF